MKKNADILGLLAVAVAVTLSMAWWMWKDHRPARSDHRRGSTKAMQANDQPPRQARAASPQVVLPAPDTVITGLTTRAVEGSNTVAGTELRTPPSPPVSTTATLPSADEMHPVVTQTHEAASEAAPAPPAPAVPRGVVLAKGETLVFWDQGTRFGAVRIEPSPDSPGIEYSAWFLADGTSGNGTFAGAVEHAGHATGTKSVIKCGKFRLKWSMADGIEIPAAHLFSVVDSANINDIDILSLKWMTAPAQ